MSEDPIRVLIEKLEEDWRSSDPASVVAGAHADFVLGVVSRYAMVTVVAVSAG